MKLLPRGLIVNLASLLRLLMKVRLFITGTAALLALWLGATFVSEVPVDRYPQFGRGSVPLSAKVEQPLPQERPVAVLGHEDEVPADAFE